ncbi:hypothetical protein [Streptococcus sanguinis]|jgi:hypothetical protein|uniref:Uncharacterized protein n=2 Tax=Streptococcus sanguinis TaxID=1305 RepID=A0A859EQL9_STRSA|nr:hypothetical protein [Streptococcus sanguinis]EFX93972.1 hypothetical protein HMPREF9398_1462 [Streptococcus sanguinis VMC66]EGC22786.1 hypothetical protein HMPREF9388_0883 [Streptococcus sanguinis SK353]QKQ44026.1 hypothetical protein FOC72_05570 [Streptococcus sanguinis]
MKKSKIAILSIVALTATLVIGGTIMTVQNKSLFTDGIFDFRSSKEKQLAYLKEHEEEIKEFVKSQNSKIESVQIDWEQTQWDQIGNGTPQGGGDIVQVYGGFNNIEKSSWSVVIEIENGKVLIDTIGIVSPLSIGGDLFE